MNNDIDAAGQPPMNPFPDTPWSLVAEGLGGDDAGRRDALQRLLGLYWKPVYCCVRFGWNLEPAESRDLVARFFSVVIRDALDNGAPNREQGRFRDFLRARLRAFMDDPARDDGAAVPVAFIDFAGAEALEATGDDPDRIFDDQWATAIVERALQRLDAGYADADRAGMQVFGAHDVTGERPDDQVLAARLGLDPAHIQPLLIDARRRLRRYLVEQIHEYARDHDDARAEVRWLLS